MKTHCQICGRAILANTGRIAHHGYQRPGQGWQTKSCFGAQWRPYEVACDALPPAIERCEQFITRTEDGIEKMLAEPPETLIQYKGSFRDRTAHPITHTRPADFNTHDRPASVSSNTYEGAFWKVIWSREAELRNAHSELKYLNDRLVNWKRAEIHDKLGPLPPEAFENDALSNDPDDVDTSPGSSYDKLKQRLDNK